MLALKEGSNIVFKWYNSLSETYPSERIFKFLTIANGRRATKKPSILSAHRNSSYSLSTSNHRVLLLSPQRISELSLLLFPVFLMYGWLISSMFIVKNTSPYQLFQLIFLITTALFASQCRYGLPCLSDLSLVFKGSSA